MKSRFSRRHFFGLAALAALGTALTLSIPAAHAGDFPFGLGMKEPKAQDFAAYPVVKLAKNRDPLPAAVSLVEYLPPIGDQGHTGSCVGWSTAYYCYSMTVARFRKLTPEQMSDPKFLFSPGWIWDQYSNGEDLQGMHIFDAFKVLGKMGCAPLSEYPWAGKAQPWEPTEGAKKKAEKYIAREVQVLFEGAKWNDPADPEKMRQWMAETRLPIVIGIPIYADFPRKNVPDDYVYEHTDEQEAHGYHAICLVGYDQTKKAFQMVNSWGERWGSKGKLWLSESFIHDYAIQGCVQVPGGLKVRGLELGTKKPAH